MEIIITFQYLQELCYTTTTTNNNINIIILLSVVIS